MPAYYDEKTKSWYLQIPITPITPEPRNKRRKGALSCNERRKSGSVTSWRHSKADLSMTFENFVKIYNEDMKHRLREHYLHPETVCHRQEAAALLRENTGIDRSHRPMCGNGKTVSWPTGTKTTSRILKLTFRTINNQLSAIMNYAVRYYNLRENPCRKAGSIGKKPC